MPSGTMMGSKHVMEGDFDLLEQCFNDATDDDVRVAALDQLASSFRGTNAETVTRFLARIVLAESHSSDVRLVAYFVLFEVCNRPLSVLPPVHEFKIPENLDLAFLYECIN
jgi:hypothetical protein